MTALFLLIAGMLILLAFLFVLPPLWRGHAVQESDSDQRNIVIARHRMAELDEQRQAGELTQEQYNEQVLELEQVLIDDLAIKSAVNPARTRGRWMVYVLALAIPVLAASLYWAKGSFSAIGIDPEKAASNLSNPNIDDINKMVEGLAERMKNDPGNAEGWLMLGRSYKYLEQYPKAVEAFGNAYRLLGDKPEVMLLYADAIALASDKNLAGKPSELIFKALELEPNNMNGLWLGGLAKVQQGDVPGALTLWRKLESQLPANSEPRNEMRNIIASLVGRAPAAENARPDSQEAQAPTGSITVEVSLAPELQKAASSGDTVFIYAQALSGPKMPLAIVRKQVADLPVKVTLDDTMAMMPAMKLSNFAEVKLLARISKSGEAVTQPGDLIGTVEQVAVKGSNEQKIVIDQRVR
ncbi:MAG: c-type cytochrome biogenesis protein CcmI [Methylosarcina sp.]